MEKIITADTKVMPFVVTLPVKNAAAKNGGMTKFKIKKPVERVAREHYINVRRANEAADSTEVDARENEIDEEKRAIAKTGFSEENRKKLDALKAESVVLEELKQANDTNYFTLRMKACYHVLDTDLGFEDIDWENADLQEVNSAISFFGTSTRRNNLAQTT